MNNLYLIPNYPANGSWSIPDDVMTTLWRVIVADGNVETVFFTGNVRNEKDFMSISRLPNVHTHIIVEDDMAPVAIGWYELVRPGEARVHWCTFSASSHEDRIEAGRLSLEYWKKFDTANVLLAVFPSENKKIGKYAEAVGFSVTGVIPGLLWNGFENRWMDATISYMGRT